MIVIVIVIVSRRYNRQMFVIGSVTAWLTGLFAIELRLSYRVDFFTMKPIKLRFGFLVEFLSLSPLS